MPQIRLEQVSKYYQQEKKAVPAVREIDLTIEQQEFVFVTGSSGAGKSTLLNLIAGDHSHCRSGLSGQCAHRAAAQIRASQKGGLHRLCAADLPADEKADH